MDYKDAREPPAAPLPAGVVRCHGKPRTFHPGRRCSMRTGRPSPRVTTRQMFEPLEDRRLFSVVAYYFDPRYMEVTTANGTPGSATRIEQALVSLGHTVRHFDLFDTAALTNALAG